LEELLWHSIRPAELDMLLGIVNTPSPREDIHTECDHTRNKEENAEHPIANEPHAGPVLQVLFDGPAGGACIGLRLPARYGSGCSGWSPRIGQRTRFR
jgi:hypothetical protein